MSAFTVSRRLAVSGALAFGCVLIAAAQPVLPALPEVILDATYVPPSGEVISLKAGGDLQKALDAANPGDEIVLEAGAVFTGNFVLRKKNSDNGWITIRGSRMEALPPPGTRVRPSHAPDMPKIVTVNTNAALRTEPGAQRYRIMGLEIAVAPKVRLNYGAITLGDPRTEEEIASDIVFDRVYIHGSVLCHCKSGIQLNGRRASVVDSHISEFHGTDQDTQAIISWSGPGPFKIVNNYLEGSGENIMFGGSRAHISGLVPSDIEFRRNHLAKPVRWRSSIIPPPQSLQAAPAADGGLAAGATYYYTVVAVGPGGYHDDMRSDPAAEIAVPLPVGQGGVFLSWAPVRYGDASDDRFAAEYRVFRTSDAPGASPRQWVWFRVPATESPVFTDTGEPGAQGAPINGHRWLVKNLFELKNAQRVLVDSNVMEYSWLHGQVGWAILITARTEGGAMPWAVTQDVAVTNNLIRHAGGVAQLLGMDDICRPRSLPCLQSSRILFRNNLFDDMSAERWSGRGWLFQSSSTDALTIYGNTGINDRASIYLHGSTRLTVVNNIFFGDVIGDSVAPGMAALARYAPDAHLANNVVVGVAASRYDAGPKNHFPASLAAVGFVNAAEGDFRLAPHSPFRGILPGGADPGADIPALQKAIAGVVSGEPPPPGPPAIASVLNAASLSDRAVAPGSLLSVFGIHLAGDPYAAATDPLPRTLGGVSLVIDGVSAPLLSVCRGQIVAQAPFELQPGRATAVVTAAGLSSQPFSFTVADSAPGLYLSEPGRALAFNSDYTLNSPSNPADAGEVLTAYLTGQGAVAPPVETGAWTPLQPLSAPQLPVEATVGGQPARLLFAVLTPGAVGVFQAALYVPLLPAGDHPLVVTVGSSASEAALVSTR